MENIVANLMLLTPELMLSASALLVLIYGVMSKKTDLLVASYFGVIIALIALCILVMLPIKTTVLFDRMIAITPLTQYGKVLLLLVSICLYSCLPAISRANKFMVYEIIPILMLSIVGMMLIISANNFIFLYLALELMTLGIYVMVSINRDSIFSSEASVKYFIMGSFSSCLYLFGASLLYAVTGHLDFVSIRDVGNELQQLDYSDVPVLFTIFITGILLILVSFAFKVSLAPFYMWAPDVYQGSPWFTTMVISTAPKVAGLLALSRILYGVFIPNDFHWLPILSVFAAASMLIGGIGAIMQRSIKRIMAYSSISHIGFAIIGLVVSNEEGVEAFIIYITIYLAMSIGVFAALIADNSGDDECDDISKLSGLGKTNPILAACITILMLSMAGIPPMAGFFGKLYIIYAAIKIEMFWLAVVAIIASVLGAYYYLRFIKVMYFDERLKNGIKNSNILCLVIAIIMALYNILYVIAPSPFIALAKEVTKSIFDI